MLAPARQSQFGYRLTEIANVQWRNATPGICSKKMYRPVCHTPNPVSAESSLAVQQRRPHQMPVAPGLRNRQFTVTLGNQKTTPHWVFQPQCRDVHETQVKVPARASQCGRSFMVHPVVAGGTRWTQDADAVDHCVSVSQKWSPVIRSQQPLHTNRDALNMRSCGSQSHRNPGRITAADNHAGPPGEQGVYSIAANETGSSQYEHALQCACHTPTFNFRDLSININFCTFGLDRILR